MIFLQVRLEFKNIPVYIRFTAENMVPLQVIGGFEMKKFMMLTAVLTAVLTLAGCCTKTCPAKGESCPKQKKCDMPCARKIAGKGKKCPFVGKWNFFV